MNKLVSELKEKAQMKALLKALQKPSEKEAELLRKMSDKAFELIKLIELELSGLRGGDGYWHYLGGEVMDGAAADLGALIERYLSIQLKIDDGLSDDWK
jgi:hypothetical protein